MQINSHLSVLIHDLAKKYKDKPALTFKHFGSDQWKTVSWNQFALRVKQVSNALLNLGIKPQDKIAVFSQNCVHYLYTDFERMVCEFARYHSMLLPVSNKYNI